MQIENPIALEKNIYHELFKMNSLISSSSIQNNENEFLEHMFIHVGLLHNALGLAFMELVKGVVYTIYYLFKSVLF